MKLTKYIIIFFAAAAFLFSSCDKDKVQSMTAKVDGKAWSATMATVAAYSYDNYFTVLGVSLDGSKILIAINGKETGTYDLKVLEGSTSQVSFYVENSENSDEENKRFVSTSGSVTLSAVEDNRVSGSFNFKGFNSAENQVVEITEGKFTNVIYVSR